MKKSIGLGWVFLGIAACGGPPAATAPAAVPSELPRAFREAFREEATGDPEKAKRAYLHVIELAVEGDESPWALAATSAAADALVLRTVSELSGISQDDALAFRTKKDESLSTALAALAERAHGPFVRGTLALALEELAEHGGDAAAAHKWRRARGCAEEATVVGPLAWTSVTGVGESAPLDRADGRVEAAYASPFTFGAPLQPTVARGWSCSLHLDTVPGVGVRAVVVDVEVPRAQRIGVAMRAHNAATLVAGGRVVLERPFELGVDGVRQRVLLDVPAGTLRLVAKVAPGEESSVVELDAWDDWGDPLRMHAPAAGEAANVALAFGAATSYPVPSAEGTDALLLSAAANLADSNPRTAERALHEVRNKEPELALVYARAIETARDLFPVKKSERGRAAYERVLEAWPGAWEAILGHAVLQAARRGASDAKLELVKDIDAHRGQAGPFAAPLLDALDAATSAEARLLDRAAAALERAKGSLAGTALLAELDRVAVDRLGVDWVARLCSPPPEAPRNTVDCFTALRSSGERAAAAKELERLRALVGTSQWAKDVSLSEALLSGDFSSARAIYGATPPGERTLSALYAIGGGDVAERTRALRAASPAAPDSPAVLSSIARALGDDPLVEFAGLSERLTAEDRKSPTLPGSATAILAHTERYDVGADGLVHAIFYDLRRVSGTADVDQNAEAAGPSLTGRATMRPLRRRIFKKDGRVLEPDRSQNASQAHADLAQLEKGDAVEAIYESFALPGDTGDIGLDTPDLLPDRTGVQDAQIEIVLPRELKVSMWSHPLLGKPEESATPDGRRKLRFTMHDVGGRRIEDGVPRMDRAVSVSLSTLRWSEIGQGVREVLAALREHDPEIGAWVREATQGKKGRAAIDAIVEASGKAVHEANGALLADFFVARAVGIQNYTARTILTESQGSRSWLIMRGLAELGIKTELALAEEFPYSADPSYPPHVGRFVHPLVLVRDGGEDLWIDADISGPPLPAGRISPELRGRALLRSDGTLTLVPEVGKAEEKDEVDLRLVVDAKGDAKGTFTILLRGREAQAVAEALFKMVGVERQRALRSVALAWVPFANVDDVQLSSSEGSWQVSLRAEVTAAGYAQAEGTQPGVSTWTLPGIEPVHMILPRARVSTLGAFYAGEGGRKEALAINTAVQYHVHRKVELASGSVLSRMPGPFNLKSTHLEAQRKFSVSGSLVEDDFTLSVPTGTIPASEYDAFVGDVQRIDEAFLASTWVKR